MKELITSPRFIGVVVIGLLQALILFNIVTNDQGEGMIHIVQAIIGSAVVVRTIDRTGDSTVIAAKINTGLPTDEPVIVPPEVQIVE